MINLKNIVENYLPLELVLVDVQEDLRGNYIRVIVDSERSVTLGETTQLSKRLRDDEEIGSRFPNGFRLEVTTPGLDQPLLHPYQYRKNINRNLKVTYVDGDSTQTITGKVLNADEMSVTLAKGDEELNLTFEQIDSAIVKISFN